MQTQQPTPAEAEAKLKQDKRIREALQRVLRPVVRLGRTIRMAAILLSSLVIVGMIVAGWGGCGDKPIDRTNRANADLGKTVTGQTQAVTTQAAAIGAGVKESATTVAGAATQASGLVVEGKAKTPETAKPVLWPIFDGIAANLSVLIREGRRLDELGGQVDILQQRIAALSENTQRLIISNQQLGEQVKTLVQANTTLEKANAKLQSGQARLTALLVVIAIAVAGLAVALGLWLKNFTLGISGVAGAVTVMVLAALLGRIDQAFTVIFSTFGWVLALAVGVGLAWLVADVLIRKYHGKLGWLEAFSAAIKTNPLQDIEDVIADFNRPALSPVSPILPAAGK